MDNRKNIKINQELHEKLKKYAKENYLKINNLIEMMIDEKINVENANKVNKK